MKEIDEIEKEIERLKDEKRIIENNTVIEIPLARINSMLQVFEMCLCGGDVDSYIAEEMAYLEEKLEGLD